ncbi:MAG: hypothetical protein HY898_01450 [Deltaproteobacteria bacterium]|nr:hypothetical protein [Deltaproteobacteria bacterium]
MRPTFLLSLVTCALLTGPAAALPPNAPLVRARENLLLRQAFRGYDPASRTLARSGAGQPSIEVYQAISRHWSGQGTRILAVLETPQHVYHHEYGANGSYWLQVGLLREGAERAMPDAMSAPMLIRWTADPHWQQRIGRIDAARFRLTPTESAFGVRIQAEYRFKMGLSKRERLVLFRRDGAQLAPVLDTMMMSCECCPEEAYPTAQCDCWNDDRACPGYAPAILRVLPTQHQGVNDLSKTFGARSVELHWQDGRYVLSGVDPLLDTQ